MATRKPLAGTPVVRLERCAGAIVRNSRAFTGTDSFLSVGPGELEDVVLENNSLRGARQATEEAPAPEPAHEPATEE